MTQINKPGVIDVDQYHALVREFRAYKKEQTKRCERLENKIDSLQNQVGRNTSNIDPIITAWNDAKGVIRIGGYIGNFFAWLGKFAIVGWLYVFVKETFFE